MAAWNGIICAAPPTHQPPRRRQQIAQVLQRSLRMEGYDVKLTDDGARALDDTQAFLPDLIVLDLLLPTVDGLAMVAGDYNLFS